MKDHLAPGGREIARRAGLHQVCKQQKLVAIGHGFKGNHHPFSDRLLFHNYLERVSKKLPIRERF